MIVQRTCDRNDPMLWSIAQAEKKNNPICINNEWLFFKSFQKHGNGVLVNFEKVETKPLDMDEVEKKLMDAFAELG